MPAPSAEFDRHLANQIEEDRWYPERLVMQLWKLVRDGDPQGPPLLAALLTLLIIGLVGVLFFRPNAGTWVMIVAFSAYATERQRLYRKRGDGSW